MVLQTFLLLDLRFKGKGLGVVALIRIKSASKIYYIEIPGKGAVAGAPKNIYSHIQFFHNK